MSVRTVVRVLAISLLLSGLVGVQIAIHERRQTHRQEKITLVHGTVVACVPREGNRQEVWFRTDNGWEFKFDSPWLADPDGGPFWIGRSGTMEIMETRGAVAVRSFVMDAGPLPPSPIGGRQ